MAFIKINTYKKDDESSEVIIKTDKPIANGFSLAEVLVVIAIIGILSALAVPSVMGWRERTKLQGAARELMTGLQFGKGRAVRENGSVTLSISNNSYTICLDDDADSVCDAGEQVLRSVNLPTGYKLVDDFGGPGPDPLTFTGRGVPSSGTFQLNDLTDNEATIDIVSINGSRARIHINRIGRVRIENL
jgi:type IV fimbrial biogenesis protein FimT